MQDSTLLDTIKQLPAVKEILDAAEREVIAQRQAKINAWHEARAADLETMRHLNDAHKSALDAAKKAHAEYRRLAAESDQASAAFQNLSNKASRRNNAARDEIICGADRRIHAFMLWARRAENLANFASYAAAPMAHEGKVSTQSASAREQSRKVSELACAAVERADGMLLEAIAEADMLAELAELADGIRAAFTPLERFIPGRLPADHFQYV